MKKLLIPILLGLFLVVSTTALGQSVAAAIPTPPAYPPFPTATPYAPPGNQGDVFKDDQTGFSLKVPKDVKATNGEAGSGTFQAYEFGNSEAFGYLYLVAVQGNDDLEATGLQARDDQIEGLDKLKFLEDKAITLKGGDKAWYSRFQGYLTDAGYTLEVRIYTFINTGQGVTLMIYSLPENFTDWTRTIQVMLDSIEITVPVVLGFPRDQVLILEGGESQNPRDNDPATTHNAGDNLVFNGLVTYGPDGQLMPELAVTWDVSSVGTVYTFQLQPNATFHNGRPFTAQDVVYSWERAADPALDSDTVMTYLSDIVGVKEMHTGDADSISGLKIIDDHTLQVSIDAPKPYFLLKLTYPTAYIVDRDNVETGEEWYRTPNGTGPYRLVRWDSMERMIYQRYEGYFGTAPGIPNILYSLYTGDGIRLYESGAIDITGVGSYNAQRVSDPAEPLSQELVQGVSLCTNYIQFDVTRPPFDDVKVRQAFSMAIDRQKFVEVVMNNAALPAKGLYPPALPGYNLDLEGLEYDPEKARKLLAESKYESAEGLPEIIYTAAGYGSSLSLDVGAMTQMWEQNLGVTITVENLEPEKASDEIDAGHHGQLISSGWCADYPDPENFSDALFHTGTEMNYGGYSNPVLDAVLEQARVEVDVNKRMALYQQAEQLLVIDAPAIFLTHPLSYTLVKPYVKGYTDSPLSTFPTIRYLWMDSGYWK